MSTDDLAEYIPADGKLMLLKAMESLDIVVEAGRTGGETWWKLTEFGEMLRNHGLEGYDKLLELKGAYESGELAGINKKSVEERLHELFPGDGEVLYAYRAMLKKCPQMREYLTEIVGTTPSAQKKDMILQIYGAMESVAVGGWVPEEFQRALERVPDNLVIHFSKVLIGKRNKQRVCLEYLKGVSTSNDMRAAVMSLSPAP